MSTFTLTEFHARHSSVEWGETVVAKVLASLPPLSASGPWLAGGAVRRTMIGAPLDSDYDFFFHDEAQLAQFRSDVEAKGFSLHRETAHHLHFNGQVEGVGSVDVQAIRFAFYETLEAVIDSFDFTICQTGFDGERLVVGPYTLWDLGRRRLAVHRVTYPVATMRRLLKYATQGFTACAGCMATILKETASSPALLDALEVEYVD